MRLNLMYTDEESILQKYGRVYDEQVVSRHNFANNGFNINDQWFSYGAVQWFIDIPEITMYFVYANRLFKLKFPDALLFTATHDRLQKYGRPRSFLERLFG